MDERKRMMKMIGWTDEDIQKLDEMSISRSKWVWDDDEKDYTIKEFDMSAREFAKIVIMDRLDLVGYWPEAFPDDAEKMTKREQKLVDDHINKFVSRIIKMLKPKHK